MRLLRPSGENRGAFLLGALGSQCAAIALLIVCVLIAFNPLGQAGFINYDDNEYVYENSHVKNGVTSQGVWWAFTRSHSGNWHPLTWLSHMLDCQLFGLNPGAHHWVSVLLHAINTAFLFIFLLKATGARTKSFLVAALFGLLPLHVQSVAWIAERKDVLCTFFLFSALIAYHRYCMQRSVRRMIWVTVLLVCALMSKSMAVTFPFLLLVLDWWPLRRWHGGHWRANAGLVAEKIPLFLVCAATSVVAVVTQRDAGALGDFSIGYRIVNALLSYVAYLRDTVAPFRLALLYPPRPELPEIWAIAGATLFLVGVSVAAWVLRKRCPAVLAGWLWYGGTLVPVIGLVQIGMQSRADRYTYVPLIGIFIAVVWMAAWVVTTLRLRIGKMGVVAVTALLLALCMWQTHRECRYWQDSPTLYRRTLALTQGNYLIENNLGAYFFSRTMPDSAQVHFTKAVAYAPWYTHANRNLGLVLQQQGKTDSARVLFDRAIGADSNYADGWHSLADWYGSRGNLDSAAIALARAVSLAPLNWSYQMSRGALYTARGNLDSALTCYKFASSLDPLSTLPMRKSALLYAKMGNPRMADSCARQSVRLAPLDWAGMDVVGQVLLRTGRPRAALAAFNRAVTLDSQVAEPLAGAAYALAALDSVDQAIAYIARALTIDSSVAAWRQLNGALDDARAAQQASVPQD